MTTYYVGPGGSDGAGGTTWATRKLTLNGAEDIPVVANDTVYVGPGVYRGTLTVDVSGSSGQPITYIADVTGENTDGVGGIVRVTGSDDDQTSSRSYCISSISHTYRTFRGFSFDLANVREINITNTMNNWIIEDCFFGTNFETNDYCIYATVSSGDLITIRRCIFYGTGYGVALIAGATELSLNASSVIENCVFSTGAPSASVGVFLSGAGGTVVNLTVKNCTFLSQYYGVRQTVATTGTIDVLNCLFESCFFGLHAQATGDIVEDYNSLPATNSTERTNTSTGSNSNTYPFLRDMPQLLDGIQFPWNVLAPSKWSQIRRIAGSGESTDDLYGITRPTTSAKKSWGAVQYNPVLRETTTTRGSSTASIALPDAGSHQIFVPVADQGTTISIYAYREANYAGTAPQMIIKEPGQSDRTTTDGGSASTWNLLSDTFIPSSGTGYVVVEIRSNNTATSGSYAAYFDDLDVS